MLLNNRNQASEGHFTNFLQFQDASPSCCTHIIPNYFIHWRKTCYKQSWLYSLTVWFVAKPFIEGLFNQMRSPILTLAFAVLMVCLPACSTDEPVPYGRIRIKNDLNDRGYNQIVVSAGSSTYTLDSKESVLLPPGVTSIVFNRRYFEFLNRYEVECPANIKEGITIKLVDVHFNRIAGGCETVRTQKTRD